MYVCLYITIFLFITILIHYNTYILVLNIKKQKCKKKKN